MMEYVRKEIIGDCILYQADCLQVLPTLGLVDHIITDPPYSAKTHLAHDKQSQRRRDGADARQLGYEALTEVAAAQLSKAFHDGCGGWVVWLTDSELATFIRRQFDALGRTAFAPLPYHHPGRSIRLAGDGPSSWTDWIVVARTRELNRWGTLRGGYVAGHGWDDKERMGGKPTRLMQLVVSDYSREGDIVCDPFMGAGTTGVACVTLGRKFIGVEIDNEAFDIACARIEKAYSQPRLFEEPAPKAVQEVMAL